MENSQHQSGNMERRVMSRIDAALRVNYQIISDDVAFNDPYDPNFVLPRYFLLLAELDQFDHAINYELEQLSERDQQIARILSLFNQKGVKPYYRFFVRCNCTIHVTYPGKCQFLRNRIQFL